MKKIINMFLLVFALFILVSCNNKNDSKYSNSFNKIDTAIKKEIETSYKNTFNEDLIWCNPANVDSFKSLDDLDDYIKSNYGIRFYGKYDDTYVLASFGAPKLYDVVISLSYDDEILYYNSNDWNIYYNQTYLYKNGDFIILNNDANIKDYLNISYNDALKIKSLHDNYNKEYLGKFMIESDSSLGHAYTRIYEELNEKENPSTPNPSTTNATTCC